MPPPQSAVLPLTVEFVSQSCPLDVWTSIPPPHPPVASLSVITSWSRIAATSPTRTPPPVVDAPFVIFTSWISIVGKVPPSVRSGRRGTCFADDAFVVDVAARAAVDIPNATRSGTMSTAETRIDEATRRPAGMRSPFAGGRGGIQIEFEDGPSRCRASCLRGGASSRTVQGMDRLDDQGTRMVLLHLQ